MSLEAYAAVWEFAKARGGAFTTLLAIADHTGDLHEGGKYRVGWPSVPTLMKKARLSERQVYRAIKRLVEAGELRVVPAAEVDREVAALLGKMGRSNLYILCTNLSPSTVDSIERRVRAPVEGDKMSPPPKGQCQPPPDSEGDISGAKNHEPPKNHVLDSYQDLRTERLKVLEWAVPGGHALLCEDAGEKEVEFFERDDGRLMFKAIGVPEWCGVPVDECPGELQALLGAGFCDPEEATCSSE